MQETEKPATLLERLIGILLEPAKIIKNIDQFPIIKMPALITILLSITAGITQAMVFALANISILRENESISNAMAVTEAEIFTGLKIYSVLFSLKNLIIVGLGSVLMAFLITKTLKKEKYVLMKLISAFLHSNIIFLLGGIISAIISLNFKTYVAVDSLAGIFAYKYSVQSFTFSFFNSITVFGVWEAMINTKAIKDLAEVEFKKAVMLSVVIFILKAIFLAISSYLSIRIFTSRIGL